MAFPVWKAGLISDTVSTPQTGNAELLGARHAPPKDVGITMESLDTVLRLVVYPVITIATNFFRKIYKCVNKFQDNE